MIKLICKFFKSIFSSSGHDEMTVIDGDYEQWFEATGLKRGTDDDAIERLEHFLEKPEESDITELRGVGVYINDWIRVSFESPNDWYFKDSMHRKILDIKNSEWYSKFTGFSAYLQSI